MHQLSVTTWSLRWLFTLGVIGVLAGLPFLTGMGTSQFLLTETSEDIADGEDAEAEAFELLAPTDTGLLLLSPGYHEQVADDSVKTESALAAAHLQRGPPLC